MVKKLFFSILVVMLGFISFQYPSVYAAFDQNQGSGGYQAGRYDTSAEQPTAFNWTRQSAYSSISTKAMLKWKFTTNGMVQSSPVIAADGTVFIGSHDGNLYAINPDGTQKWTFDTGGWIESSPAIAADGTVYIGSDDGNLYAIDPANGNQIWAFSAQGEFVSSPSIATDGTIYIGCVDANLYAIDPNGSLKWKFATGQQIFSSPAIAADGTIYIGNDDGILFAIDPTSQQEKWNFHANGRIFGAPVIGGDGTIYFGTDGRSFYAVHPDGTEKWHYTVTSATDPYFAYFSSPAIAADGTIYVGSFTNITKSRFFALAPDGSLKWSYAASSPFISIPIVDSNGNVFVGSNSGKLFAFDRNGALIWDFAMGRSLSSPAIAADGTIYIGDNNKNILALTTFNVAPTASDVTITGTFLVNQTLTGSYTYTDQDGDSEGASTFTWYTANDASGTGKTVIAGETSKTLLLTPELENMYIMFEVTPVAGSGMKIGQPVVSAAMGPVVNTGASTVKSTITIDPSTLETDGTLLANGTNQAIVTVQLKDSRGNDYPDSGGIVALSTTLGNLGSVTDMGNGTYTATLTPVAPGTAIITGTLNGTALRSQATLTIKPAPVPSNSVITANPLTQRGDGISQSTITVQLKDLQGNNWSSSGGTVHISTTYGLVSGVIDHQNGTYTATVTATVTAPAPVEAKVSGTLDGKPIGTAAPIKIVFYPDSGIGSSITSKISVNPDTLLANGTSKSDITVQLKDYGGNNVTESGGTVELSTTLGTVSTVIDNGDGTYSATLTSENTGMATISGKLNGFLLNDTKSISLVSPKLNKPFANPASGIVAKGTMVTLETFPSGAAIYYTTDGSTPDRTSTLYTSPISINRSMTIKAIAVKDGMIDSEIMSESYSVPPAPQQAAKPTASPAGGPVAPGTTVTLTTQTPDADIYYTIDGSTPDRTSTLYTDPIRVDGNVTIKAIAVKDGMINSEIMSESYSVPPAPQQAEKPMASPAGGPVAPGTIVTLTTQTPDADIYYTTDGDTPDRTGTLYNDPIRIDRNVTIKAIAVKDGLTDSEITKERYTITPGVPSAPQNVTGTTRDSAVALKWDAAAGAKSYSIYMYEGTSAPADENDWMLVHEGVTQRRYFVEGLINGVTYAFAIKAFNSHGSSDFSNVEIVALKSPDTEKPYWPANEKLVITDVTKSSVTLVWPPASDNVGVTGYTIFVDGKEEKTVTGNVLEYRLNGLNEDTTYTFTVKALDKANNESDGLRSSATTLRSSVDDVGGSEKDRSHRTLSDNTNLQDLRIFGGDEQLSLTPSFTATKAFYWVKTTMNQVEIVATPAHTKAKVTLKGKGLGNGKKVSLEEGENKFELIVQAESGAKDVYTIIILRETEQPSFAFSDSSGHWAESFIQQALLANIANGFPDGTFKPDNPITRAEFTVMLMKAANLNGSGDSLMFTDNALIGDWAKQAIAQAVQTGVTAGYEDGSFRPDAMMTRAEMITMITRAFSLPLRPGMHTGFADDTAIPQWAKSSVEIVRERGLVQGRGDNLFFPNATATRAEALVMLLRMLQ
ncbi:MAG: PQQ-binding-like beta-propeller repeat protein [Clostridia bacterium]